MKILAWDTSSKTGTLIALKVDHELRFVSELTLNVEATHSERLLWGIHQVLESAHWKIEDVDCFGVGVGPGSFTGLRIGVTTARTLAQALEKPLVGVSSLAALARPIANLPLSDSTGVLVLTDACKGEVFALWGGSTAVKSCVVPMGIWTPEVRQEVISQEQFVQEFQKEAKKSQIKDWIVAGEGFSRYPSLIDAAMKGLNFRPAPLLFPHSVQGRYLGYLVWEELTQGSSKQGSPVLPHYLRASDAELKLKARLGSGSGNPSHV